MPSYYLIGTKFGVPPRDMLPEMLARSDLAIGFAHQKPLRRLVGLDYKGALAKVRDLFPNERADAQTQLARFFSIRPGDVVALKSHGAPKGREGRLVIARYAVVAGEDRVIYRHVPGVGHAIAADYLDNTGPLELNLGGYGRTVHHIRDPAHQIQIFGAYGRTAEAQDEPAGLTTLKSTHTTVVASRREYLMTLVHNALQNALFQRLRAEYGDDVCMEADYVDISVILPTGRILVEVKQHKSPTYCIREALGQLLHYASRSEEPRNRLQLLVVGPTEADAEDLRFLEYVRGTLQLPLAYCTPEGYNPSMWRREV